MTRSFFDHVSTTDLPQYVESIQGGIAFKANTLICTNKKSRDTFDMSRDSTQNNYDLLSNPREAGYWLARLKHLYECNPLDTGLLNVIQAQTSNLQPLRIIRIAYIDMYPGHDPTRDILTHAIRSILGSVRCV